MNALTIEEIAMVLDIGRRTVDREWAHAKAWLYRQLSSDATGDIAADDDS